MQREVGIVGAVRTAIGSAGGSLKGQRPTELAALVSREALSRAGVEATGLGHAVFGNVIATEPRDLYLAHVAALITVKALYELQRVQGRHALVTMCIGGGQGMAAVFERG